MHLIKLRVFPFMLQHLHHLFNQHQAIVASVQNVPFSLKLVDNEALVPVTWNATVYMVMSTRSGTLGVPVFPSDFRILVMVLEGPADLPDAILQMSFVFDSFRFSTWVFSDWSSRFQGNSTGDFHNACFCFLV